MGSPGVVPTDAVYAGDEWARSFTVKQDGDVVDLTARWSGWTAQWRPAAGSAQSIDLTVDETAAATGVISISATGTQTESMAGDGVWDLQAADADHDGAIVTWLRGSTKWTQDVTR